MKTPGNAKATILAAAAMLFLAVVFSYNTLQNASHEDYRNSNFSKFWIAGHMITQGLNPYDPVQWYEEHVRLGSTWTPDRIFLYPLPQAFILAPFGLVPAAQAFLIWSFLSQIVIAAACFLLLKAAGPGRHRKLFIPLVLCMLFFGPAYLTLQVGSIGGIALAVIVAAILLLSHDRSLLAGLLLSLLILKPSQGLPLLLLIGLWFLFRRNLRAVVGMLVGGLALLISGLLYDPQWIQKFLGNSAGVSARTAGEQSNVFSFADLACRDQQGCMWAVGIFAAFIVLAVGSYFLWRNRANWNDWQALNLIIPLGFLTAPYSWSYDQLLYVIPIVWITARLMGTSRPYLFALLFLVGIDVVAFIALAVQAYTQRDLLSVTTTGLVLGAYAWLLYGEAGAVHGAAPAPLSPGDAG
ncbi:MAG TPA: glycosyltransferase family 87 protein [Anaerolineales bacterium]